MNWEAIGAAGELVEAIAVVVTLAYLAVQIRTNTKTVRASNYGDLITSSNEFNSATIDPATASLWVKGLADYDGLSAEEQARFSGVASLMFNAALRAHHLHQKDLLSDEMWESLAHAVDALLENVGVRQWWKVNHHWYPVDFRELVSRKL